MLQVVTIYLDTGPYWNSDTAPESASIGALWFAQTM